MALCSPDPLLTFPEHFRKFMSLILTFYLILIPSIHSVWLHIHLTLFSLSLSNTITCLTSFCVILMSISLESSMGWVTIRRLAPAFSIIMIGLLTGDNCVALVSRVVLFSVKFPSIQVFWMCVLRYVHQTLFVSTCNTHLEDEAGMSIQIYQFMTMSNLS